MNDNMKNKILLVVLSLCVMACTIGVLHLIFDEHTKLFYINVITTCICEIILLSNIPLFSSRKLLTFKNAATSTVLDIYAILMFLWTIAYSPFIEKEDDFKPLYIGMLILTVIFAIALGIIEVGGNVMQKVEAEQTQSTSEKKHYLMALDRYYLYAETVLATNHSEWKGDTLRSLKLALDKLSNIPSNKLEQNQDFVSEANRHLDGIKDLLEKLSNADEKEDIQKGISLKIEQLKIYVTTSKNSL